MTGVSVKSSASREAPVSGDLPQGSRPSVPVNTALSLLPVVAAGLALALHTALPARQVSPVSGYYAFLLKIFLLAGMAAVVLQFLLPTWRRRYGSIAPLVTAVVLVPAALDLVTLKFALFPLPYFPGPDLILKSLWADRGLLIVCVYHSILLLLSGYFAGTLVGLATGVLIGWYPACRYWLMPVLKTIGPVPATVWIPLSLVLFPHHLAFGSFPHRPCSLVSGDDHDKHGDLKRPDSSS